MIKLIIEKELREIVGIGTFAVTSASAQRLSCYRFTWGRRITA